MTEHWSLHQAEIAIGLVRETLVQDERVAAALWPQNTTDTWMLDEYWHFGNIAQINERRHEIELAFAEKLAEKRWWSGVFATGVAYRDDMVLPLTLGEPSDRRLLVALVFDVRLNNLWNLHWRKVDGSPLHWTFTDTLTLDHGLTSASLPPQDIPGHALMARLSQLYAEEFGMRVEPMRTRKHTKWLTHVSDR